MGSRLDLFGALGLDLGEVHLIRNAGGVVTGDVIRSLLLSPRLRATTAVMVVHHTRCGLETFEEEVLAREIETERGRRPPCRLGAYGDGDRDVRETVAALRASPFIDGTDIRGFVFDVDDGSLREVLADQ